MESIRGTRFIDTTNNRHFTVIKVTQSVLVTYEDNHTDMLYNRDFFKSSVGSGVFVQLVWDKKDGWLPFQKQTIKKSEKAEIDSFQKALVQI